MAEPDEFDVAVVGGGAAGCVVAARLAGGGSRSIVLLEAGPDLRAETPEELRNGWHLTKLFDWGYTSERDIRGETENLRRGKLVGGTSWVTRFGVRGSPADYDEWAALGNPGWRFDEVLPYFKRLETDADFGDQPWHGSDGPIPIRRYTQFELTEIGAATLQALEDVGFPVIDDHNRPGTVGAGRMPMSSHDGIRVTTADAYLPMGDTPRNLTIRAETQVADVVFEGDRAAGVRLLDGTMVRAGGVVLSAGVYGSPAILMRSGIGPADHLRSVGVLVRDDLPGVGANLADHPAVDVEPGYTGASRESPLLHTITTFHSAAAPRDGPSDLMFWVSDPRGDPPEFSIDIVFLKPRSRGTVRLRSADPTEPPAITLPGVRDQSDVMALGEGYSLAREVAERPQVRKLCASSGPPAPRSEEDLREWIRANAYQVPHVVGTCAMGPSPDDGAVVDSSGRVHGTERLSVIDASIMPIQISGFPHIPTIMMAERLSEQLGALI